LRDGVNGLLVPPGDEPALAQALVRLLQDKALRDRLAHAAGQTVAEGYTWQSVARRYQDVYRSAVSGAPVASTLAAKPAHSDRLHDPANRAAKADKILIILHNALGDDLSHWRAVDIGCASGLITRALAPHLRWILGVEYAADELRQADATSQPNLLLVQGDGAALPLPAASVDLALCSQVYEHVADADALAAEVYRVLTPGGVCFFSGPNRLDPIERHHGLPLLSWLPRPLADAYVRLAGRGDAYRERSRTYWGLRRLWRCFAIEDYTLAALRQPQAYHLASEMGRLAWLGRLPVWLLRMLRPLYPNSNWVLRKQGEVGEWQ
jgi:SAM-dependent methyltransferase